MNELSEDMKFEVDVFWVAVAAEDPVKLIRKLKAAYRSCTLRI